MSILSVLPLMRRVTRAECLDPKALRRLRQQRFRRLLKHVFAKSRFYGRYYRAHGIAADQLDDIELRDLPTVNKQIVMDNFDALVCDPALTRAGIERFFHDHPDPGVRYRGRYYVMHTSGSTGSFGIFAYGPRDWDRLRALVGVRVLRYRPRLGRLRYAFFVKTDGHHGGVKLCQSAPRVAFQRLALSINIPLDETLGQVRHFQPHLLGGYSSNLHLLAQQQLAGQIRIRPERIISSGEPLTDSMKRTISEAFGAVPIDFYAACESLAIGVSCRCGPGLHLFDDWHGIEIVDEQGRPARPEVPGRLILTNLYNYTQPLIRYEMNDELTGAEGPCPCGSPLTLVRQIAGRVEEMLWFPRPDGTRDFVHPLVFGGLNVPGVRQWQAVQTRPNELLLRLKIAGAAQTAVQRAREEVVTILRHKHLEPYVTVRTEVVHEIPSDPQTGKYRLVIPYQGQADSRESLTLHTR